MRMSKCVLTFIAGMSLAGTAGAAQPYSVSGQVQKVESKTQLLEQEVLELQKEVKRLSNDRTQLGLTPQNQSVRADKASMLTDDVLAEAIHAHSLVSFGPYLNIRARFDGSELIVNTSSIREASRILQHRYNVEQSAIKAGKPIPEVPHLILSGVIGGQIFYQDGYADTVKSEIDLTNAELDTYVLMNRWISGYISFTYDNGMGSTARKVDHSNVHLNRAFAVLGDLSRLPVYSSFGQYYVPFGRYSTSLVSSSLAKSLGRTKERAWQVGYQSTTPNSFYGELYIYKSTSGSRSERSTINDGGIDVGYAFYNESVGGSVGVSVISNLADADAYQNGSGTPGGFSGLSCRTCSEDIVHRVPAVDAYGQISFGKFNLLGEFLTAMRHFDSSVGLLTGENSDTAKPRAEHVELGYTFDLWSHPSAVALAYDHTADAVMLGVPNFRWGAAFNTSIWKHTLEQIEVRRDYNYSYAVGNAVVTGDSASNLGKARTVVSGQIYVYF